MYSITVDPKLSLVEVALGGMMTPEEVTSYIGALKREFVIHKLQSYGIIVDVSACPIQSQDMITAMGQHMATMPKARSIAVVTGRSLARMQARRLFKQPYTRIASNLDEGRAWVLSGVEPPIDEHRVSAEPK